MLKLMRRRYRRKLYRERVELIKDWLPDSCIGVDVITGHPGETDSLFRESMEFIDSLPVSYLHVFTYSERPNTHALHIKSVIPVHARKNRTSKLRRLSTKKRYDFNQHYQSNVRPVLFEEEEKDGYMHGWTDNYIRVAIPYSKPLANTILDCELVSQQKDGIFTGKVVSLSRIFEH